MWLHLFVTIFGYMQSDIKTIDPNNAIRVFDGHGALSAGANSRLLLDYPTPQR